MDVQRGLWTLSSLGLIVCSSALGQGTIQFPRTSPPASPPPTSPTITIPGTSSPTTPLPSTTAPPAASGVITAPPAASANPYLPSGSAAPFDPYSPSGSAAYSFWSTTPGTASGLPPPITTPPAGTSPLVTSPPGASSPYGPPILPGSPTGSFPTYGPPAPSPTPQYLFPGGLGGPLDLSQSIRFIQDLRLRHTYLGAGNDPNDVGINDTEAAVTFTLPNFLTTGQPLYISPAFALHLWDGPSFLAADLPPSAYSAYLDFQWASDPNLQLGAELGFRLGVYSDFNTLNDQSLRIQGLGLGIARLTPTVTLKLGVMYLDRNNIKLLPAGGVLWTPTPQVRFDIFFPQPKLSAYLTTVGQFELWWYLAGEYGGGAWTIERASGTSDRIDINDIRASAGLEWTGPRGLTGFVEGGFVFKRQVIYVVNPAHSFDPGDTFMVRAGVAF